ELAMLVQPHTGILEPQSGHVAAAAQRHEKRLGLESFARAELERESRGRIDPLDWADMWNSTPCDSITSRSMALISWSAKGRMRWRGWMTRPSSSPSTLKRQPSSQPMVPPPAIASDRGSRSMCWIVSESYTPGLANGNVGG